MSKHFKMVLYKAALLSMALSILGFTFSVPSGGDLDTTFDRDGRVTTNFGRPTWREDSVEALAIQPDGKIVAAGSSNNDFALARYNLDGSLDTSFSGDGRLLTNFGANEAITDVAAQEDGKIVASGYKCIVAGECDVALARYNADGTRDTTFSGDGKVTTDIGRGDNGSYGGIAIQDGKIVVAGDAPNRMGGMDSDFAVYR